MLEDQHASMVKALAKDGALIADEMTVHNAHLLHLTNGILIEAGKILEGFNFSIDTVTNGFSSDLAHMIHMAVGIAGEAGELLDAVKKSVIYQKELDRENVIEELGDLEFYQRGFKQGDCELNALYICELNLLEQYKSEICKLLDITREETLEANIKKLGVRYGDQYSDVSAQVRKDKIGVENG